MNTLKECSRCHEWKPMTEEFYYRHFTTKDKFENICKACKKEYYNKNKAHYKEYYKNKKKEILDNL